MSVSTRRTSLGSRRGTRKSQISTVSYDIYCMNFYDNGLLSVRNEYINQAKIGLRRFIFMIDLDNEIQQAKYTNELNLRTSKQKKQDPIPTDRIPFVMLRIQDCLEEYENITKRIDAENSFNLLKYFQRYSPAEIKFKFLNSNQKDQKAGMESKRGKPPAKSKETTDTNGRTKIACFGVTSKEHHKVGKGQPLSKRQYIKDQPQATSIIIIIVGKLDNDFYQTLISYDLPLRGIIHFLPEECAYDVLVPRPRRLKELRATVDKIQGDIYSLRKRVATKEVGILEQQLPQMSVCQATKYASEIYGQLSWFIYDVQKLREYYEHYYVKPYHEINVMMKPTTSMQEAYNAATSLSIEGHYLNQYVPLVHDDDASIYLYLESLLNTFGSPKEVMTEIEVLLLANPSSMAQTRVLDKIKVYASAFKSIVKLCKTERLFIEEANPLLTNVVSYMDQKLMRNIYHACLEYNILRRYFNSGYTIDKLQYTPYANEVEPKPLPKFGKLYLTDDAVTQRIVKMIDEFEHYKIEEIHPRVKLYTFRRRLNEVFEKQKEIILPSRLCFRDFTLFSAQEFLKDLVTPEMFEEAIEPTADPLSSYPSIYTIGDVRQSRNPFSHCTANVQYMITPSVFIRPKSLKANKLAEQEKKKDKEKEKEKIDRHSVRTSKSLKENSVASSVNVRSNASRHQTTFVNETKDPSKEPYGFIGLGPDHPLLKGYNLSDTLQTIKAKTSKYHFEEGHLTLYQEKWNFRQTNKYLKIEIDKQVIHLTNECGNMAKISNNIRVQTANGVHLRIRPNSAECAKAVLNYPNGLSLYCHDTHAEHLWSGHESDLNESRRICTPYGCVIVFYNENDTVVIMRYNGEVYRLYSFPDAMGGEEEGEMEETSEYIKACSTQSAYSNYRPLSKSMDPYSSSMRRKRKKKSDKSSGTRESGGTEPKAKKSTVSNGSTSSQTLAAKSAKAQMCEMKMNQTAALFASIDSELKFLDLMMSLFDFSYVHLKLTTSLGSVVHVEGPQKIYCGKPIRVTEWHDYCANESYSMRDDGVRMVWTHDMLKCYHSDGTVINTTTSEGIDFGVNEDDIDKQISSSSSHKIRLDEVGSGSLLSNAIYINVQDVSAHHESKVKHMNIDEFLEEGEVEDQHLYDYTFITFNPDSHMMAHKFYASTQFSNLNSSLTKWQMETTVIAADNLQFRIYPIDKANDINSHNHAHSSMFNADFFNVAFNEQGSSEADPDEWTHAAEPKSPTRDPNIMCTGVEVNVTNVHLSLAGDELHIRTHLLKFGCSGNQDRNMTTLLFNRGNLTLKLNFDQNLSTVFNNWVEAFHKFVSCSCAKWKTTYFLETTTKDCRKKGESNRQSYELSYMLKYFYVGLELFKTMPPLGVYNFCAGNYFLDPEELKSVHGLMMQQFKGYEQDMAKFPRFPQHKKSIPSVDFPAILTTKIFVEIPAQLAYTDRIHLFLAPFGRVKFRKLKHRFNEALLFHLYPHLRTMITQEISKQSWRNHHAAYKRRHFMEQQRLSLYSAMLKHKVYPNYFQFKDNFYSHVRNIDFFEFMSSKCNEKEHPEQYMDKTNAEEEVKEKVPLTREEKKNRKKCLCPKYIKSLK
ncbi:hypothetical protein KR093_002284 [Drosophila rubida]|uniref:Uncharacterized protein n=1 Tax=Drosophila rubida TaxID=30044 RepID=A0AAD4K4I1_9MUSC|nr:hypothetical protein KR093_002284 [Drosophila rubida]